jgi:hypothetical protein
MPKTRERLLSINPLKRAVDNTIAGTVLIDQYHRMYLLGTPFWSYFTVFAKAYMERRWLALVLLGYS